MSEALNKVQLHVEVKNSGATHNHLSISVPASVVDALYQQALLALQKTCTIHGFSKGHTPLEYIAQNFTAQLKHHIRDFCLHYFVIPHIYRSIRYHKLLSAGLPRLMHAHVAPGEQAVFTFQIPSIPSLPLKEWKYLPFKPPRRKRYKDLDRQAEQFIKTEQDLEKSNLTNTVNIGDWVNLAVAPAAPDGTPLFGQHTESFWLKIGQEEADKELHDPLCGKRIGDSFVVVNEKLQNHFCNHSNIPMTFAITINDIIHDTFFCFEQFKKCFKLKSKKEIIQKLIEVFSYQHDISQRRAMAERSIGLLLSKNKFEIPQQIFTDQQAVVMHIVKYNPDYYVYRTQKDFQKRIEQLAKKQAAEMLILDQIAYEENLEPTYTDIRSYLNLMKRPRTKEFIYFNPPITRLEGQETLLYHEEIAHLSCREKTLNHIIHYLTRA